jgi:hypothetical protein
LPSDDNIRSAAGARSIATSRRVEVTPSKKMPAPETDIARYILVREACERLPDTMIRTAVPGISNRGSMVTDR